VAIKYVAYTRLSSQRVRHHCHRGEEAAYDWPFGLEPSGPLLTSLCAPLCVHLFRPLVSPLLKRSVLGIARRADATAAQASNE
jgi:hypothetical protein